ncbi:hypothetical protein Sulac_1720 [Sulfobacillus acidophilus DSM 10332]|uniref:Uncharacterized protein n=1 Tax=Sulfobacillus acidophilus (strain ATCC 700253 / DSM 10332 / NAL) TaxID=679936 RepID=G8TZH6_SULAD|nr:hypothetical protein Sulac_1720 [Sulfobacillus acidophilus DSM 10332]
MFPIPAVDAQTGIPQVESVPVAGAPVIIGTFSYTNFTASSTYKAIMSGVLHRNAAARSFIIANTLNEALTSLDFYLFDSTLSTYSNTGGGQNLSDTNGVASNGYAQYTSEAAGILAFHGDSVIIEMGMGATAPTTGEVQVYVVEVFR